MLAFRRDTVSALSSPPATIRDVVSDICASSKDLMLLEWIWYRLSHEMIVGVDAVVSVGCFTDKPDGVMV